ncbi:MAG: DUF4352 domain-containing protein [Nitrosopumilaceae archaeon]|nr:DUF4352 domain-containing protein [Nitrosopumilaceae archaeon]NIU01813.1 DUF4352 domain-containing protein [Nitrosopumilaceae archaeon]NIU88225.1 DUF4352 domain-containing protein [Nitrosopumilaceae archaeon]NIV65240.1 DUF4352 domain-containing protein [Nitrosopumilaceae archaeon]NIX62415.1 DUF4352 domain-containing protein [Nitrosopumilaceae archaeon]
MRKKALILGLVIGVALGVVSTYYSVYALTLMEIQILPNLSDKDTVKSKLTSVTIPKTLFTDELKYVLLDTKRTDFGVNGEMPLEGGVFLIAKIEIENLTKEEIIVYGKNWFIQDAEDRIYKPHSFNAKKDPENIFSIRIPPGFTVVKNIGFEIPTELDSGIELYVADSGFSSSPILLGHL